MNCAQQPGIYGPGSRKAIKRNQTTACLLRQYQRAAIEVRSFTAYYSLKIHGTFPLQDSFGKMLWLACIIAVHSRGSVDAVEDLVIPISTCLLLHYSDLVGLLGFMYLRNFKLCLTIRG